MKVDNITFGVAPSTTCKNTLLSIKIQISGLKADWGIENEENVERK